MATGLPAAFAPLPGHGIAADEVHLGHVQGAFGVRGEVRVYLFHPESDLLARARPVVLVDPEGRRYGARLTVRAGAGLRRLGRVDGLADCDVAASLAGWQLAVPAADLPPAAPGEVYVRDLLRCDVEVEGEVRGRVRDVHTTAGGDVLVVDVGADVRFVPLVRAWVEAIDVGARRVVLRPGALDEP